MNTNVTRAEGYHVPALLKETLSELITEPNGIYIDATFGGGGHTRAILTALGPEGHLFSFDQDRDAAQEAKNIADERFTFIQSNFRYVANFMSYYGITAVDGILADLGVSSHHLDDEERGFSFRFDAPIDMRMNQRGAMTASKLIETSTQEELASILKKYGEVRGAYKIAGLLKEAQNNGVLNTTKEFLDAIQPIQPSHDKKGLAQIFQGLRIAVNDELGALEELLQAGCHLLTPGGHFCIITYHSLEDRPVKNFFRTGNLEGIRHTDTFGNPLSPIEPLRSKPTTPSDAEVTLNPRIRSAQLRTAVKKVSM